ncbi:MAG: hypothetical protein P857_300 [Candidatus Xenolissoclinum pacificiensis L6]|uniref:Uncharacterized protein n=1 Tax=Candidatus Xenolissoclinum pacificiensis L6 TaxID=1401685 RepID=W2UZU8_9RICK|nr:MAG: hypothetical protein P857_300 [Candidatus Xenolissoclinum pacificiensis L6]
MDYFLTLYVWNMLFLKTFVRYLYTRILQRVLVDSDETQCGGARV